MLDKDVFPEPWGKDWSSSYITLSWEGSSPEDKVQNTKFWYSDFQDSIAYDPFRNENEN